MKSTIKDVAKAAGVSPSTVSRAMHNNPRISEEMRGKIRALADEMGFHPNQMARSLVNRKTRIIGIVFPGAATESLGHPFYPKVLQGLGRAASERRYQMLLGMTEGSSSQDSIRDLVDSGYVSGLVLLAAEDGAAAIDAGVPTVVIGRPRCWESCYCVDNDNVEAGREATDYLIRLGHRQLLLLGYDKQYMVTVDRRQGYEKALEQNGIVFRRDWVVPSRFLDNNTDQELLWSLFRQKERPTGVVCMDDAQAIGLTSSLSAIGLSVPGDVSIVSFNNTEAGRYHNPPLTSMDVNPGQLGYEAMNMVLDLVKEKANVPHLYQVPFQMALRGSATEYRETSY
ncbi:MAG: LacI family DNA-binding transcriptional regulator [Eubacteriales bacterium]|nr:LacI family DNA-binding transcriptional regulator [Eubacteriales bacterium]